MKSPIKHSFVKNLSVCLLLVGILFLSFGVAAQTRQTKSPAPQTAIDYLRILPKNYLKILAVNDGGDRSKLIRTGNRTDDFLRLEASNFAGYAEIALFRKKSGASLVALNEYVRKNGYDDGGVVFYEYERGKWKEIEALPAFTYGDLLTAFRGKTRRAPTDEEMNDRVFEIFKPSANEITLKIGGIPVYGFSWNGTDFDGGMLYLAGEK